MPCPSDITVDQDNGTNNATVTWSSITITDNDMVTNTSQSHNSGDTFLIGTTQVTVFAQDASGNNDTCEFMVIVRGRSITFTQSKHRILYSCELGQDIYNNNILHLYSALCEHFNALYKVLFHCQKYLMC